MTAAVDLAQEIREALVGGFSIPQVLILLQKAEKLLLAQAVKVAEYEDDHIFLSCLRAGGVDNWEWYGEACEDYRNIVGEDDD